MIKKVLRQVTESSRTINQSLRAAEACLFDVKAFTMIYC